MSYKIFRNFIPKAKVTSFEPLSKYYKKFKKIENKDKFFNFYNFVLSNNNEKSNIYILL